jgi:hypothetical protein
MKSKYLLQKDLGSQLSIDTFGDWKQVTVATEAIKNHQNKVAFLVAG